MKRTLFNFRSTGFSIPEILIAVTLFALAAVVLGRAVADQLSFLGDSTEYHERSVVRRIQHIILRAPNREFLEAGGEESIVIPRIHASENDDAGRAVDVRWEVEIFPTRVLNYLAVTVLASWEEEGRNPQAETWSFFAYRPNWVERESQERLEEAKEELFQERAAERGEVEL